MAPRRAHVPPIPTMGFRRGPMAGADVLARADLDSVAAMTGRADLRLGITDVAPVVSCGSFSARAVVGEHVPITATVFREGHDAVAANVVWSAPGDDGAPRSSGWRSSPRSPTAGWPRSCPTARGRWTLPRRGVERPAGHLAPRRRGEGRGRSGRRGPRQRPRGGRAAARPGRRRGRRRAPRTSVTAAAAALRDTSLELTARIAPAFAALAAGLPARAPGARAGHPLPRATRSGSTGRGPSTVPGTSSSRAPRAPSSAAGPRTARSPPRRSGCPPSPTWASTSSTCRRSTRSAGSTARARTHRSSPAATRPTSAPTTSARRGRSAAPRAGTTPSTRSSARWRTSAPSSTAPASSGMEVALDFALQAAPDHPWVEKHPEWFTTKPDGTIAYAENPPKKYQDIYPINFDNDPEGIYAECLRVIRVWIDGGRQDLPRRQPAHQAAELLALADLGGQEDRPRRAVPGRGVHPAGDDAPAGPHRVHAVLHVLHLAHRARRARGVRPRAGREQPLHAAELLREHPGHPARVAAVRRPADVQDPRRPGVDDEPHLGRLLRLRAVRARRRPAGQRGVPRQREVLSCGPATGRRPRPPAAASRRTCARLNEIRRAHPALQQLRTLHFHPVDNPNLLCFSKTDPGSHDAVIVVVNLSSHHTQIGTTSLDLPVLGLDWHERFAGHRRAHRRDLRLGPVQLRGARPLPGARPRLRGHLPAPVQFPPPVA